MGNNVQTGLTDALVPMAARLQWLLCRHCFADRSRILSTMQSIAELTDAQQECCVSCSQHWHDRMLSLYDFAMTLGREARVQLCYQAQTTLIDFLSVVYLLMGKF